MRINSLAEFLLLTRTYLSSTTLPFVGIFGTQNGTHFSLTYKSEEYVRSNTMSVFINAKKQLTDKSFFGEKVAYRLPKNISVKEKKVFLSCHNTIKQLLASPHSSQELLRIPNKKVRTIQLKKLVSTYFLASPEQQSTILQEGILSETPIGTTVPLSHLIKLYKEFIQEHKIHKTKNLNINYLDTWDMFNNIKHNESLSLDCINRNLLDEFVKWRYEFRKPNCVRKGLVSDAIIHKEIREIKNCLEWSYAERLTKETPRIFQVKYTPPIKGIKQSVTPLSIDEQIEILDKMKSEDQFFHDYFLLLLTTGLRVGEINSLSSDSFDLEEGSLSIHSISIGNSISGGKTESAPRKLPLTKTLLKILERGHIFQATMEFANKAKNTSFDKELIGDRNVRIQSFISRRKAFHKLPKSFHLHQLRHTFVTNNLQAERPTLNVSRCAGHKSISITTDRYGKYSELGIKKSRERFQKHLDWLEDFIFEN